MFYSLDPKTAGPRDRWIPRLQDTKPQGHGTQYKYFSSRNFCNEKVRNFLEYNSWQWKLKNLKCKVLSTTALNWIHPDHTTGITPYTGSNVAEKHLLFLTSIEVVYTHFLNTERRISANTVSFFKFWYFKNTRVPQSFLRVPLRVSYRLHNSLHVLFYKRLITIGVQLLPPTTQCFFWNTIIGIHIHFRIT